MSFNVKPLLARGLQAQQSGDLVAAQTAYEQILAAVPDHPDACQLMGLLARRRGAQPEAEVWFRRSLASRPDQAHVWNNLGNLLLATDRVAEALAAYDNALRLQPGYVDALYNHARALCATSQFAEAERSLQGAMRGAITPTAGMLQLAAEIQSAKGELAQALDTLQAAVVQLPRSAPLWHALAVALQRAHRYGEALQAHERAAALGLVAPDAHYNRGNTLQSLGRLEDAVAAYRAALAMQPGHQWALGDLARLRWRRGAPDFDLELRQAMARLPSDDRPAGILAGLLSRAERFADALPVYEEALRRAPGSPGYLDGMGTCLVRLGQEDRGLARHREALAQAPSDPELRANLITSLLVCGRSAEALDQAEALCRAAPRHQRAQALRLLALRLLSPTAEPSPWLFQVEVRPPLGWSDMDAFNQALAEELRRMHGVERHAPIDQSLRGGTQTFGDLFALGHPLIDALKERMREAVTDTVANILRRGSLGSVDPFFDQRPLAAQAWRFSPAWSSRLAKGGHHVDHVHPHGWMSSAYYVQVPPGTTDSVRQAGWLRFGVPDFPVPSIDKADLVQHVVQPRPGTLVLFPSHLWHGTHPFEDGEERLTIAFDVVPS